MDPATCRRYNARDGRYPGKEQMDFETGVTIGRHRLDPIVLSVTFIVVVSAVFLAAPQIDIWFTGLFYDPATGFPATRMPLTRALRDLNTVVIVGVLAALLTSILIKLAFPKRQSPIRPQVSLFILATLIAGPVIVVNGIFKTFSGRPRPNTVDLFGGNLPFIPIWHFTDYCSSNCSFVAGEGSSAFWALTIWLVAPSKVRRATFVPAIVYVVAISLNRIAFGGHFLSDVLMSWSFMALIIAIAYRIIIQYPPAWLSDEKQEERWTRAGLAIRRAVAAILPGR